MEVKYPKSMQDHIEQVFAGEYDVHYDPEVPPIILDIGANVGSFAIWASLRWPQSVIHCFEPASEPFLFLQENTEELVKQKRVFLNNYAIGNPEWTKLRKGKNNCGENSFFELGEQQDVTELVQTKSVEVLPVGNILKVDTEGCEYAILSSLFERKKLSFTVIMLEWHADMHRRLIDQLLAQSGYTLVGGKVRCAHRGIFKYKLLK